MSKVEARAHALLGTRFRPHGRDPARGLDCVGLVAAALDRPLVPTGYALRSGDIARLTRELGRLGLIRVTAPAPGDVLVLAAPAGLHLAIATAGGMIHACATLARVVERARPYPWPLAGTWRLEID